MTPRSTRLIFLALLSSACTAHLRPKPDVSTEGTKVPMRAALVVPAELTQKVDDLGGFDSLSGSYAVDTGATILPAVKEVVQSVFQSVDVVQKMDQVGNADVVLVLKQIRLVHPSGRSNDYELRFDLRTIVSKPDGVQIIDASYADAVTANKTKSSDDALKLPLEKAISATLVKFAADLRTALGAPAAPPPPTPPAAVAEAAAPSGAAPTWQADQFTDFPPPPPSPPASSEVAPAPVPPPVEGTESPPPVVTATPAPASEPAAAPAPAPAPVAVVAAAPAPSKRSGVNVPLVSIGALLFLGGYLTPPIVMNALNLPGGTSNHGWVPFAGALLAATQNPFLSQDQNTLILTIASTAAQGLGLILAVVGAVVGGSSSSSSSTGARTASLSLEGEGWALIPGISPAGVSVTLIR